MSNPAVYWRPAFSQAGLKDPTYRRRCHFVLQELNRKHGWDVSEEDKGQPLVVLQRFYRSVEIRAMQNAGRAVVAETNDCHLYRDVRFFNADERASLEAADYVVTTCRYMQKDFARINPQCLIAHEALEDEFWTTPVADLPDEPLVLSWHGTNDNLQYVEPIIGWLATSGVPIKLKIVMPEKDAKGRSNAERCRQYPVPVDFAVWRNETWVAETAQAHAGIVPLPDTIFCRMKAHHKVVGYQALGLPCIASDMPGYREVIRHGETGLLAAAPDGWANGLKMLMDPAARKRMGEAGREFSRHFTRAEVGKTWNAILEGVCADASL